MASPDVLDGGWAWAVVLGGAINNFLSMGFYRSGGIIYISCTNTFHTSRAVASWIPMVTVMVVYLVAPVGTVLCKRFSYPRITFIGGLLASFGMFICYLATRIEYMFVGWGVIFGFGSSLAFFPTLAIVGQYFKVRRPMANGLILTGGALGAFTLPPLLELLVRTYGLRGTTLITSGVILHYCLTSGLLLLAEHHRKRHRRAQANSKPELKNEACEKSSVNCYSNELQLDDEFNDKEKTCVNRTEACKKSRENCYSNEVSLDDEVNDKKKKTAQLDTTDRNGSKGFRTNGKATEGIPNIRYATESQNELDTSTYNSTPKLKLKGATEIPTGGESQLNKNVGNGLHSALNGVSRRHKQSEILQSSLASIGRNTEVNMELSIDLNQDLKTDPANKKTESNRNPDGGRMKLASTMKNLIESLELRTICNCTFLINCGSNAIQTALFMGLVTILPDYGEDELGIPRIQAAYFVSASAIADLLTRFLSGWILSTFTFDKNVLYFFVLLINAGLFAILAVIYDYTVIMVCSVLAGICFAFGMVLYFEILASCQSTDRYPLAFGLSEMMKSPLLLLTAASVGSFKDATGSYSMTLFIFCGLEIIASIMWCFRFPLCRTTS